LKENLKTSSPRRGGMPAKVLPASCQQIILNKERERLKNRGHGEAEVRSAGKMPAALWSEAGLARQHTLQRQWALTQTR
jgi:hypothetical protein